MSLEDLMHFAQHFSSSSQKSDPNFALPEHDLLLAVLDRSVLDYHGSSRALRKDAAEWLFNDKGSYNKGEFSFEWVCEQLGIEEESVRASIKRLNLKNKAPQGQRWLRKKVKRLAVPTEHREAA